MEQSHTFHAETADVQVSSLMEALGDRPFFCIVTGHGDLPVESYTVTAAYPLIAAQEALDLYKEKHSLNLSEVWAL